MQSELPERMLLKLLSADKCLGAVGLWLLFAQLQPVLAGKGPSPLQSQQ